MKLLNQYFDNVSLIKQIVKYRIALASKRHDFHFFNDLRQRNLYSCPILCTNKSIDDIIIKVLPSRRAWIREGKNRKRYKNSTAKSCAALEKTIFLHYKRVKNNICYPEDWYIALNNLLNDFRQSLLESENYTFKRPKIIYEKKNKGNSIEDKADKIYRPLAHFYSLKDKILIGQTAKYLTDIIDSELCDDVAFAFRSHLNQREPINHHDAIEKIKDFIEKRRGKQLWVAECDIKKFYDCINHEIAKKRLHEIISRLQVCGIKPDPKAIHIFNSYLNSYAFNYDVEPLNNKEEIIKKNIVFEWERDNLIKEFYPDGIACRIGIPQGGAISCLIANVIMDKVDRAVLKIEDNHRDENLLYVRYCDDMVIIHTEKSQCQAALNRYQEALKDAKLLCHKPIEFSRYTKSYFAAKSKLPYELCEPVTGRNSAPWLTFVGYQIRYDGIVRIRKKSLLKELEKQNQIVYKTIKSIRYKDKENLAKNARRSAGQIKFRVENPLISMSVGRIYLHNYNKLYIPQLSWAAGFKKLNRNSIIENQLKHLDRNRTKNLQKLSQKLKKLKINNNGKPVKTGYLGSPFSYHNFILNK